MVDLVPPKSPALLTLVFPRPRSDFRLIHTDSNSRRRSEQPLTRRPSAPFSESSASPRGAKPRF
eukprot:4307843-Alexandrium_andersonii.AAC.1